MRRLTAGFATMCLVAFGVLRGFAQDDAPPAKPAGEAEPGAVDVKSEANEKATRAAIIEGDAAIPSEEKRSALDGTENAKKTQDNRWRFRWHNGTWWYWMPSEKWVLWDGRAWVPFTGQVLNSRGNFGGGYYGNTYYDDGFYGGGGYYGNQYHGGEGYYGNSYYGHGGYYANPYGNDGFRAGGYPYSSGYRGGIRRGTVARP